MVEVSFGELDRSGEIVVNYYLNRSFLIIFLSTRSLDHH
jgi:hypothetical protein